MVKQASPDNNALVNSDKGEVIIYQSAGNAPSLEVRLEKESIWLNLNQIATLFERDKSVISRHLSNVYREGELVRDSVVAFFATTAADGKTYQVEYFNLDAILSVGYRVNSKRGTQFRIWATGVLRKHLVEGYTANERRLQELRQTLSLVENVLERYSVSSDEAQALLRVVTDYAGALDLLDDYDHKRVKASGGMPQPAIGITYKEALRIIAGLRKRFGASELFGLEKDESLHSSLDAVMQTFDSKDVYPSLEDKAAHLLYFLVKNHSFADGNKRIAAALFLWFMQKNKVLLKTDGSHRIADNALVAITLMIAESRPVEKDIMCRLVTQLISERPQ
ncbi:MAG: RhuM family protein [Pseudomonadota bacterium]